jgi:hypothetical protein
MTNGTNNPAHENTFLLSAGFLSVGAQSSRNAEQADKDLSFRASIGSFLSL